MSLLLSHLKPFVTNTKDEPKNITSTKALGEVNQIAKNLLLAELSEGDMLEGEVIDLRSNEVTIQLSDQSTLKATIEQDVDLFIGQKALFEVVKNSESGMCLKIAQGQDQMNQDHLIEKVLFQAQLPASHRNKEVVSALLDANLSVDKQSIMKFLKICYQYPNASIKSLAFLKKHEIPITSTNIEQLENYHNSEHRIVSQLEHLANDLGEMLSEEVTQEVSLKLLQLAIDPETTKTEVEEQAKEISSEATPSKPVGEILSEESLKNLAKELSKHGVSDDFVQRVEDGSASTKDILKYVYEMMEQTTKEGKSQNKIQKLFLSEEIKTIYKEEILLRETILPKQIQKPNTIKKYYERLEQRLDDIQHLLRKSDPSELNQKLTNQTEHIKNNLEFMKVINEIYPYLQLPLHLRKQNVHSELYVFKKHKGSKIDMEDVSVLLHLDMERLGGLDIQVKLKRKTIQAKFMVETQEVKDLFEDTKAELAELLEEAGYQVQSEVMIAQEKKSVFDQMVEQEQSSEGMLMKRYTFDIRA